MQDGRFENDKNFRNRAFWDRRYIENAALGSGVGSRGKNLLHKRAIIANFLEAMAPESILDIGCGDHEVLSRLELGASYIGVDISETIVKSNSLKFVDRTFYCADFVNTPEIVNFRCDVILCLEVLIHQHIYDEYCRLVKNLIMAAKKGGLISAYRSDPRSTLRSPIIAYHEPITDTLHSAGAIEVEVVGESQESNSLVFVAFRVSQ